MWLCALRFVFERNMVRQARLAHVILRDLIGAFEAFWASVTARSKLGHAEVQKIGSKHMVAAYSVSVCPASCKHCQVSATAAFI